MIKASDAQIGGASTLMFRSTVAPFTDDDDTGLVGAMQAGRRPGPQGPAGRTGAGRRPGRRPAAGGHDRGTRATTSSAGRNEEDDDEHASDKVAGEERLLIDGELRPARSGRTFETVNPATEEVLGVVADGGAEDMDDAIGAARRAFDDTDWSTDVELPGARACASCRRPSSAHADEIRAMTVAETGSPLSLTYSAQLDAPVESLGWVADLAEGYEWETDLGDAAPHGHPLPPLGAAGGHRRGRGHHPVERAPPDQPGQARPGPRRRQHRRAQAGTGHAVVRHRARPARSPRRPTSQPGWSTSSRRRTTRSAPCLSTDPRVDQVSFTGSTATGRKVMASAADSLKKVFLELGGKSAFVILDDADLRGACATAAFTVCTHAGQGCAITTRLLVPRAPVRRGGGVDGQGAWPSCRPATRPTRAPSAAR